MAVALPGLEVAAVAEAEPPVLVVAGRRDVGEEAGAVAGRRHAEAVAGVARPEEVHHRLDRVVVLALLPVNGWIIIIFLL